MKYTKEEMLSKVDHTLLKPEATWPQIGGSDLQAWIICLLFTVFTV